MTLNFKRPIICYLFYRRKILEACRGFKHLVNEARERASKALGFTKKLRNDLENAAKFSIDIGSACLLAKLKATEHVQVNKPVSQSCTEHSRTVPK